MTGFGGIFVFIIIATYRIAFPHSTPSRAAIFFTLAIMQVSAAILFWQFAQIDTTDTKTYYFDLRHLVDNPFRTGTIFVVKFVQAIKHTLGGSYFDHFLMFSAMGMVGIAFILRTMGEIAEELRVDVPLLAYAALFLPGFHFWTSGIGKDAPLFMSVSMVVWSMLRFERRYPFFIIALIVMTPIRPHVAAISLAAMIFTLLFDTRLRLIGRMAFGGIFLVILSLVLSTIQTQFRLDPLNANSISDFLSGQEGQGFKTGTGTVLVTLPFPLKVFSLLFRPLFFDASGIFGLVVSFENIAMLYIFGTIIRHGRTFIRLTSTVSYLRFCGMFAFCLIILLSLVYYNVGLGLRQKFMAMPPALIIFMSILAYRKSASETAALAIKLTSARAYPVDPGG